MEKRTLNKQKHIEINYSLLRVLILLAIIGIGLVILGKSEDPNIYSLM